MADCELLLKCRVTPESLQAQLQIMEKRVTENLGAKFAQKLADAKWHSEGLAQKMADCQQGCRDQTKILRVDL